MKALRIILLTVFYMLASAGVEVKAHYCHGKLAAIRIELSSKNDTCCCAKKSSAGCCKTTSTTLKVTAAQDLSFSDFDFHPATEPQRSMVFRTAAVFETTKSILHAAVSIWRHTAIYLSLRVLRI